MGGAQPSETCRTAGSRPLGTRVGHKKPLANDRFAVW